MANDWEYNVSLKELQPIDDNKHLVRGKLGTIDETTGEVIGLVSPKYNLVQNSDIVNVLKELSQEFGLTLDKSYVMKDKKLTLLYYKFGEEHNIKVNLSKVDNDIVSFKLGVLNSFDSASGGSRIFISGERLSTFTNLVMPKDISTLTFKQIGHISATSLKAKLSDLVTSMGEMEGIWNRLAQIEPKMDKVNAFLLANYTEKKTEKLLEAYDKMADGTLWGIFNLLSEQISHHTKSRHFGDAELKKLSAQKIVAKLYKNSLS